MKASQMCSRIFQSTSKYSHALKSIAQRDLVANGNNSYSEMSTALKWLKYLTLN